MRPMLALSTLSLALALACAPAIVSAQAADAPAATAAQAGATSEDARINAWFERKYEEQLQTSPMGMTMLGRKDRYGELDDMSREAAAKQVAWQRAAVEEMKRTFDYDALGDDAKLSWACSRTRPTRQRPRTASPTKPIPSSRWAARSRSATS